MISKEVTKTDASLYNARKPEPGQVVYLTLPQDQKLIGSPLVDVPMEVHIVEGLNVMGHAHVGVVQLQPGVFVPQILPISASYCRDRVAMTWRYAMGKPETTPEAPKLVS